jgi:hypothetical protein
MTSAVAAAAAAAATTTPSIASCALIGLFPRRLIVSSKGLPSRLRPFGLYNSALFLASCFCSFLLHVVASLSCIFLVSRRLVLLSTFTKKKKKKKKKNILIIFLVKKVAPGCASKKFHLD